MKSNSLCENTTMRASVNLTHVTSSSPVKAYEIVRYAGKHHATSTFSKFQIKNTIHLSPQFQKRRCQPLTNTDKRTSRFIDYMSRIIFAHNRHTCVLRSFSAARWKSLAVPHCSAHLIRGPAPIRPAAIKSQWSLLKCHDRAMYPTSERTQWHKSATALRRYVYGQFMYPF